MPPRGYSMSLAFPPFTPWVKRLIIANSVILFILEVLRVSAPNLRQDVLVFVGLVPQAVTHGYLWQLATYSFLHATLFHLLFNMLWLWMFGSQLESDWGSKRFLEFYFFCVVGAALITVSVAYTGLLGLSPRTVTIGSSGGIYGILVAFGVLYGNRELMMFPLPFVIKAKYLVMGLIFIAVIGAFQDVGGVANFAHLGGALFGYLYVKFLPRRGLGLAASEGYFGLRNEYYRWKRRRAAKKFQVYMKRQGRDVYFDEYGNYRGPGSDPSKKKNGESKSPWVH
jgi:membrane associated rhomboid family serine protease